MSELTPAELDAIRERAAKATVGEWAVESRNGDANRLGAFVYSPHIGAIASCPKESATYSGHLSNMVFIAHARTDIPRLLAHVAAMEAERAELKDAYREMCSESDRYMHNYANEVNKHSDTKNRIATLEQRPTFADAVDEIERYIIEVGFGKKKRNAANDILTRLRALQEGV